ncbi:MAG: winged helix-turn-helix transcriptional regulator [Deltaproteobacteria bacterium]|nr:winged helix-turn-helix transcriptional regulator [Deltaproteobacteria bacterium]
MAGKKIDDAMKEQILRDFGNGISPKKIAEKLGISVSSVNRIAKTNPGQDILQASSKSEEKTARQKKIEDIERRILLLEKKILEREARKRS